MASSKKNFPPAGSVRKELNDAEQLERGRSLARTLRHIEALEDEKKQNAKDFAKQITAESEKADALRTAVLEGWEWQDGQGKLSLAPADHDPNSEDDEDDDDDEDSEGEEEDLGVLHEVEVLAPIPAPTPRRQHARR